MIAADREANLQAAPDAEMRRRERENLRAALRYTKWKIAGPDGAAELLGLQPTTLASRVKALGLSKP
ncbi:MAG: helix-turn-helix domain-containing protein [Candidatus Krumholzibacteriia bacterium]